MSTVKGYLGELLVKTKLENDGLTVTHLGNQSGYDLQFECSDNIIKIDVKFSMLKYEYDATHANWGWALLHQNKKRKCSCTHIVCVAVDNKCDVVNYYVIPRENIHLFPQAVGQFSGVKHGFILFKDKSLRCVKENVLLFHQQSRSLLQKKKAICISKKKRLSDILLKT